MKKFIAIIAVVLTAMAFVLFLTGCAEMERSIKTFTSDVTGGLPRTVTLYTYDGTPVQSWAGKIDIASSEEDEILFDMNGKRTIIQKGIGIVVIQEN